MSEGLDEIFIPFRGEVLRSFVSGNKIPDYAGQHNIIVGDVFNHASGEIVEKTNELVDAFEAAFLKVIEENHEELAPLAVEISTSCLGDEFEKIS